ncbi:MAG: YbcC family protein [Flavobacteriales bacterium]
MKDRDSASGCGKKFDKNGTIHKLKHYLPQQAPLKDFVHHNTLHAFQGLPFHDALRFSAHIFGARSYLPLDEYRRLYAQGQINPAVLRRVISIRKGTADADLWEDKLLLQTYDTSRSARIGTLREKWKDVFRVNLDKEVHPLLFRLVNSYLDQGLASRSFPVYGEGFLDSLRTLEQRSHLSFFRSKRVRGLLQTPSLGMEELLTEMVGRPALFEQYLFDQQFAHPGWSGMVSYVEDNPGSLLDRRKISLHDFIMTELLLELDTLEHKLGKDRVPLGTKVQADIQPLFTLPAAEEKDEVFEMLQEAYEWSYYDQVLTGLQMKHKRAEIPDTVPEYSFQAFLCIDDREGSLRRHLEELDPQCRTYGTPGFFNVAFYFRPASGKFYTKACPVPLNPRHVIKETESRGQFRTDRHFNRQGQGLLGGWIMSQTLGFLSPLRLLLNLSRPSETAVMVSSSMLMHKNSRLTIENRDPAHIVNGLQVGFTVEEMADRVEQLLKSTGLVCDFAPLVYVIGHGASSVNNTHYAGYDCGACGGRPGSVNARVFAFMANHAGVRRILRGKGVYIPESTQFIGALHDTTRDEIEYFDEDVLHATNGILHARNALLFEQALDRNAAERAARFPLLNRKGLSEKEIHRKVKRRAVSLFEPRPELNHATNALCIIGRRESTEHLFLNRRSFMHSYDYRTDSEGKFLAGALAAATPVAGGINLEYYFSRVDPSRFGAGSKLSHNVMGLIGVANGTDGDLRTGLPVQMTELHEPMRLLMVIEQFPDIISKTLSGSPDLYEWFANSWIHLVALEPGSKKLYLFGDGRFREYSPVNMALPRLHSGEPIDPVHSPFAVYRIK